MIRIKPGVRIYGIKPETTLAIYIADGFFRGEGLDTVITSVMDGKHSWGSLHYVGAAVDLRTSHLTNRSLSRVKGEVKDMLGQDYDVVLEATHLHIEFQPKEPY